MKILILGAGQVGSTIAEILATENNDVTLVDKSEKSLRDLHEQLDIRTIVGKASHPQVLRQSGAADADLLIAVTSSDEVNMVACQIAYTLFRTPKKIARLRSSAYMTRTKLFGKDHIPIDVIISPEQIVTNHIKRLVQFPGALQVTDFANGRIQMAGVKAYAGGQMIGHQLRDLAKHLPDVETRVAAIFRHDKAIIPVGDTVIEGGDEVFFIAGRNDIQKVIHEMQPAEAEYKRVMIAGGGNIGERLAEAIETRFNVKLIEYNRERAVQLSNNLVKTLVLHGSASDKKLLQEENIQAADAFIAVTNDDEANIMSCLLAKRLGARKVMTLINNPAYVDLVQGENIDVAISPKQSTIGSLLTHIRRGDIVNVHSLRRGAAEAMEIIVHGDKNTSKVAGRKIEEIDLPHSANIGMIARGDEVLVAHHDTVLQNDDHVIVFVANKKDVPDVEKLFQVSFSFFN